MQIKRILRHLAMTPWQVRRAFPVATLKAVEEAIGQAEKSHRGEVRVAVESALHLPALLHGQPPRARALDVFSLLRVWDTEHNNGVLVYVLLADRAVEIVVDRGLNTKVAPAVWQAICRDMEAAFRQGSFREGMVAGVAAIARVLAQHFADSGSRSNELPDAPVML